MSIGREYFLNLDINEKAVLVHTGWSDHWQTDTYFENHKNIAEGLNIDFYFAKPYHSWQRGANENLNGLIRQYFPKGCSFERITNERIIEVQNKLNKRPRKRFGYDSPNEVFAKILDDQAAVALMVESRNHTKSNMLKPLQR